MTTSKRLWANALKRARLGLGLNQLQVATLVGTDQQRISDWENARREPSDDIKPVLIERLGIDPRDVVPEWLRTVSADSAGTRRAAS